MKKIILTALSLSIFGLTAYGAFLKVETITPFSTPEPPEVVELKALSDIQLTKSDFIKKGDTLSGELTNIKKAKRLKQDATFSFKINSVKPLEGEEYELSKHNVGKYLYDLKIDAKKLAVNTALKVTEQMSGGLSMGYRALEGAIANRKEGLSGVAKGAVGNMYDNSVLGYAQKGQEIVKDTGDVFYLVINTEKVNNIDDISENDHKKGKKSHVAIDNPNIDFLNIFAEILSK